jgi:hypothetical protein
MLTAFMLLASPIPGLFVHFYLQSAQEIVEPTEQVNNCHQFENAFIIQP